MTIQTQLSNLVALQQLDLELHRVTEQLDQIPERRAVIEVEVNTLRTEIEALTHTKSLQEAERRDLEGEVADAGEHLKNFESKLHAIKTNKEYQAALKEIAEIKRANKEKDDRCLKLMEEIDAGSQKITQLSQSLADKEAQVADAVAALVSEAAQLTSEQGRLTQEREGLLQQVAPEVMRAYKTVRTRYVDAMASVEDGICSGCRMKTPPQLYIELQRGSRLCLCPSCHRILFVPEKSTVSA